MSALDVLETFPDIKEFVGNYSKYMLISDADSALHSLIQEVYAYSVFDVVATAYSTLSMKSEVPLWPQC